MTGPGTDFAIDPALLVAMRRVPFGNHLGAEYEAIRPGYARARLDLRPEHQNFNGNPHGGVIFSLADLALGAASNSHGTLAALVSVSLNYVAAPPTDARLVAEATELRLGNRLALYRLEVRTAEGALIASGEATCYRWPDRAPGAEASR